jgi:hypothetical protein
VKTTKKVACIIGEFPSTIIILARRFFSHIFFASS